MAHSTIVGGSSAKRVINCPGSVALVTKVPPKPSSSYAEEGTFLHECMERILNGESIDTFKDATEEQINEKLRPAFAALDEIDPDGKLEFQTEVHVAFSEPLQEVFGSCDVVGRRGDTAIILDWKFGSGVWVDAEENDQLMFYAAAAMHTESCRWAFEGVSKIECIIVQPPYVKVWETTPGRIKNFERELVRAIHSAMREDAPLKKGDHCRWCAAKAICPLMNGEAKRAVKTQLDNLPDLSDALKLADLLEPWIKDVRDLALRAMEEGKEIADFKLVSKRATRQWVDAEGAREALEQMGLDMSELMETKLLSVAQAEKVLKKHKFALPKDHVVSISTGNTIAPRTDPRPAVSQLGQDLLAFSKMER